MVNMVPQVVNSEMPKILKSIILRAYLAIFIIPIIVWKIGKIKLFNLQKVTNE